MTGYRWTICALLFFATTINYLDRQVLSLLAPVLTKEFGWSNNDYANITATFQFVYAISMLFAGRVIDKMGTKRAYILAIVVWSIGAVGHAAALAVGEAVNTVFTAIGLAVVPVSVAGFIIGRAVLALGEAGNFPAAIKATAEYFPKKERSFATGIFNSGANVGAILAPLTVPLIAHHWGWQAAFISIGAIGFLWMGFWIWLYDVPERQPRLGEAERAYINSDSEVVVESTAQPKASWFQLLGYRQTWAFAFGKFMTDGVWWFFLFWLPKYMSAQYQMSGPDMVIPLAVLYSMTMVGSIGGGWLPTWFINRGHSIYQARMRAMFTIAVFPLVVLLAQPLGYLGYWFPIILIGIGASAHQAWSANLFTTVSDMFPKHSVGSVVGIGGMAGAVGGMFISLIVGAVLQSTGSYVTIFIIAGFAYLFALLVIHLLVPRLEPVKIAD
jgi:ACS family hexuronate transporter-like MFS transporter